MGIPWNTKHDEFVISFRIQKSTKDVVTKRELLKRIAPIFDPVGILSPAIVPLKILFQSMCKEGGSWDDDINDEFKAVWKKWLLSAHKTSNIVIPRYYLQKEKPVEFYIIGYCDASDKAYSAVTYLRVTYKNEQVSTQIIAAKTRVFPVKVLTTPQLELMSNVLLARLVHSVYSALTRFPISKVLCLTDSAITLAWIQNEKKQYKQFVHNRVKEVRVLTKTDMWYHLPRKENIADLPSRGCLPEELSSKRDSWINGPSWLSQKISTWPISKDTNRFTNKEEEKFINKEMQTSVSTIIAMGKKLTISVENVIDPYRYSTLKKILSVTATCLRFVNNCHGKRQKMLGEISAEELNAAKKLWICDLQKTISTSVEFNKMKESLGVYEHEDGYLWCKGQLGRGKLPFDTKLPILLPNSHHVTELVVQSAHEKVYHNGVRETLLEIRSKYWIPKGRQTVKRILNKCLLCRKLEGLPYPSPAVSDLPEFRVVRG